MTPNTKACYRVEFFQINWVLTMEGLQSKFSDIDGFLPYPMETAETDPREEREIAAFMVKLCELSKLNGQEYLIKLSEIPNGFKS